MDQQDDKWWQVRLGNVLASVALFGLALAWWRYPDPFGVVPFLLCGSALGGVFGRYWIGLLVGLVVYGVLLFAAFAYWYQLGLL